MEKSEPTQFGAHVILWDEMATTGKCQICGRKITRQEFEDNRNKDCGIRKGGGR